MTTGSERETSGGAANACCGADVAMGRSVSAPAPVERDPSRGTRIEPAHSEVQEVAAA